MRRCVSCVCSTNERNSTASENAMHLDRSMLPIVAVLSLASCASAPERADDVPARASQAMGATRLDTLRYSGDGTGYTFGQAFTPGGAWPKITVHTFTRTIDFGA